MCNCKSYNKQIGEIEEVTLKTPDGYDRETVCIDACIVDVIKYLWSNNIVTLSSCCGHNERKPSIVTETSQNIDEVFKALSEIDNRRWEILRWELKSYEKESTDE